MYCLEHFTLEYRENLKESYNKVRLAILFLRINWIFEFNGYKPIKLNVNFPV